SVAATVVDDRTRFHATYAHVSERELEHEVRALHEEALAPPGGTQRKAPLGHAEVALDGMELNQSHRRVVPVRHDGEAYVLALGAALMGPVDEPDEALHRRA